MRGNREFQGGRVDLRVYRGVNQVHMADAPQLNSQRRNYIAQHVRPKIGPQRGFGKERRNSLGQLSNVMRHRTGEGGGSRGCKEKAPLRTRNEQRMNLQRVSLAHM